MTEIECNASLYSKRMDPFASVVPRQLDQIAGVLLLQRHCQDCFARGAGGTGAGREHDTHRTTRGPAARTQEEPPEGPPLTINTKPCRYRTCSQIAVAAGRS
jgi:hypothetical protein